MRENNRPVLDTLKNIGIADSQSPVFSSHSKIDNFQDRTYSTSSILKKLGMSSPLSNFLNISESFSLLLDALSESSFSSEGLLLPSKPVAITVIYISSLISSFIDAPNITIA